jgi:hypothetical protein
MGNLADAIQAQRQALAFATDPGLVQAISAQLDTLQAR